jgi:hypothetical protein
VRIDFLFWRECPSHPEARELLSAVLEERGVDVEVVEREVLTQAEAEELAFPGSPTIRVDGRDVDPEGAGARPALTCRIYHLPGNHCPYVQAWEGRLSSIARGYADRGVRVVAVNSNDADNSPEDSFEEMQKRSQEQGFAFDYLYDEPQAVARALEAERTPEVFVYDRNRRLRYHGAIDDNRDEMGVSQQYLRDALDAVLAGDDPSVAETPPVGCTVKWR